MPDNTCQGIEFVQAERAKPPQKWLVLKWVSNKQAWVIVAHADSQKDSLKHAKTLVQDRSE